MGKHPNQYITVRVYNNDIEKALRILKKKIQNEGTFKILKEKSAFEKPSSIKRRKKRESIKRVRMRSKK